MTIDLRYPIGRFAYPKHATADAIAAAIARISFGRPLRHPEIGSLTLGQLIIQYGCMAITTSRT